MPIVSLGTMSGTVSFWSATAESLGDRGRRKDQKNTI